MPSQPLILISDDDSTFVSTVRRMAVRQGLRVVTDVLSQAPNVARLHKPDLILLDVNQPVSGLEMLRQVKQDRTTSGASVMMMSGISDKATRQKCLEAGADAFLLKPLTEEFESLLVKLASGNSMPKTAKKPAAASRGSVLIVDDSQAVLDSAGRAFEEASFQVFTLDNPFLIGSFVRRKLPDVVVVDMDMPGMNGKQAVALIAATLTAYKIHVFIHSSGSSEQLKSSMSAMQATGFIRRSSDPKELVRQVLDAMGTPA